MKKISSYARYVIKYSNVFDTMNVDDLEQIGKLDKVPFDSLKYEPKMNRDEFMAANQHLLPEAQPHQKAKLMAGLGLGGGMYGGGIGGLINAAIVRNPSIKNTLPGALLGLAMGAGLGAYGGSKLVDYDAKARDNWLKAYLSKKHDELNTK